MDLLYLLHLHGANRSFTFMPVVPHKAVTEVSKIGNL